MNDSFGNNSALNKLPPKYPPHGPPNDTWTIEQLLHWSLHQHHSAAISRTQAHIDALRSQCDSECEDVMTLHELAVEMKEQRSLQSQSQSGEGENADPQRASMLQRSKNDGGADSSGTADDMTEQPATATATANNYTHTTLVITVTSGPHASQSFKLQPRYSQPCLIGRSKGKKFLRNGISLNKDQEVSTTHGKFSVEQQYHDNVDGNNSNNGVQKNRFYYTDVGSTNGSMVGNDVRLEPNVRMEIEEGMELRIGNSTLKIVFG